MADEGMEQAWRVGVKSDLHSPLFLFLVGFFHVSTQGQMSLLPQMVLSVCTALDRMCPSHPHNYRPLLV